MAYVAVKGGKKAIDAAGRLVTYYRLKGNSAPIAVRQIMDQMRLAVDRVMGEGSLYAPELAALALKQAEGDTFEAAFLLRAFRSTLPRSHYSLPVDTTQLRIIRRISAAFKDVPGGQYLGPTRDYSKRLLDFELLEEGEKHVRDFIARYLPKTLAKTIREAATEESSKKAPENPVAESPEFLPTFPRVIDLLRQEGLLGVLEPPKAVHEIKDLDDITRQSLQFPASRATRLQTLARGETGSMMALAYSSMRGYGAIHPSLGELKVGYLELIIPHPLVEGEIITVGEVLITEVELIARMEDQGKDSVAKFTLGYGSCFGQNEIKAISMATLDRTMMAKNPQAPAEDEEFVLYHIDGIEASGFTAHWKLPHYVDFQADLNRLRSVKQRRRQADESL